MSENQSRETPPDIHPQEELPIAVVQGKALDSLPKDLYIPPQALEVFLEAFEGPLDLLLYLIRRENVDIVDIPVADITRQYVVYIELMQDMQLELAGEYLVMSAMLAEIKSRMLLPRQVDIEENEEDPRAELVRRLQEYERYKQAAEDIDALPRLGRDVYQASAEPPERKVISMPPQVDLQDLISAFQAVMKRASMYTHHHVHGLDSPIHGRHRRGSQPYRLATTQLPPSRRSSTAPPRCRNSHRTPGNDPAQRGTSRPVPSMKRRASWQLEPSSGRSSGSA